MKITQFRDIPKFISDGSYELDVELDFLEQTLTNFQNDCGLELNPDFQRGHVWTEEQQIDYLEFLLRGGRSAKVIYFNSPAYASQRESGGDLEDTILCVDGLQRLTAALRFVRNEIPVFGSYRNEYSDKLRVTQGLKFNVNCLQSRKEILEWYLQFNSGGTVHTEAELNRVRELLALEG